MPIPNTNFLRKARQALLRKSPKLQELQDSVMPHAQAVSFAQTKQFDEKVLTPQRIAEVWVTT